ncbi:hypothetical protein DL768_010413 [Monosporascus sp. mg162]|nr:hypothetical protein DL768_010413 [Monosporascus sp. mg162]
MKRIRAPSMVEDNREAEGGGEAEGGRYLKNGDFLYASVIAGSLTQGITQLVTHLSHKARKFNTNGPYGGWYDDEAYQELKTLWDSVHGAHLTRIKEAREFSLSGAKEDNPIVDDLLVSGSHQPGILEDPTIQFLIDTSEGLMKKKAEEPHGDEQESDGESEDEAEEYKNMATEVRQ